MPLDYTSDIELIIPRDVFEDPISAEMLAASGLGIQPDSRGNKVMLFKDPKTVAALLQAEDRIVEAFVKSGYGLKPWQDTERGSDKTGFVCSKLHEIAQARDAGRLQGDALSAAVIDLVRFMDDMTTAKTRGEDGLPVHLTDAVRKILSLPAAEPFDVAGALNSGIEEVRQDAARGSAAAPAPARAPRKRGLLGRLFA